jgi:hypothetical protein
MATVTPLSTRQPDPETLDPRVSHPLDRLRGVIRRYVVIEGVLSATLFFGAWFALGLLLDFGLFRTTVWDWVLDAPLAVRVVALIASILLFLGLVTLRIVQRLTKELSYAALALVLERRFPQVFGDRLITAVELSDVGRAAREGYSADMIRQTIAEARSRVADVPVHDVFNWRRLWVIGFVAAGLLIGTVVVGYAAFAICANSYSVNRFAWRFAHVTGTFLERDVLLWNTPWPRQAHLELVDFPDNEPLRVGRDNAAPTVRARAYRYVVADPWQTIGWRPMMWADLQNGWIGKDYPPFPFADFESVEGQDAKNASGWKIDDVENKLAVLSARLPAVRRQIAWLSEKSAALQEEVKARDAELLRVAAEKRKAAEDKRTLRGKLDPKSPNVKEYEAEIAALEAEAGNLEKNHEAMAFAAQVLVRRADEAHPESNRWQIKPATATEWRSLRWGDLKAHLGSPTLADLPGSRLKVDFGTTHLPTGPMADWTIDQVAEYVPLVEAELPPIRDVIDRITEVAERPSMGRTLRRLDTPGKVVLAYAGKTKSGEATLTAESNNEFAGQVTELKEDVWFTVKAEDFRTEPREIHLVNPPLLEKLVRTDFQPAYLYHAPPVGEWYEAFRETPPDRMLPPPRIRDAWATQTLLATAYWESRKLPLQRMRDIPLSLTGDRTVFSVPAGSEVVLSGVADTELRAVYLEPRVGLLPGAIPAAREWVPIKVGPDGRSFSVELQGDYRLGAGREFFHVFLDESGWVTGQTVTTTPAVEFDLILEQKYGVQSRRQVSIQTIEDQAPGVDVVLDGVRKVNSIKIEVANKPVTVDLPVPCYLVTADARLEFNPDSFVKDDRGLSEVSYEVDRWVQTYVEAGEKGKVVDTKLNRVPESSFPVGRFVGLRKPSARSRVELEEVLRKPLRDEDRDPQVTAVPFNSPDSDFFDVQFLKLAPNTREEGQLHYRMDLTVQAVDNNFATGPRKARSREPINLLVVSEPELLAAMNEDEDRLAKRVSDTVDTVARARANFQQVVRAQNGSSSPIAPVRLKAIEVEQDVNRARIDMQGVLLDCRRLHRECRINRVTEKTTTRYGRLANRVDRVLGGDPVSVNAEEDEDLKSGRIAPRGTFKTADPVLNQVANAIVAPEGGKTGQWADQKLVDQAEVELVNLEFELIQIREELGTVLDLTKKVRALKLLLANRKRETSEQLLRLQKKLDEDLTSPTPKIVPVGQVLVAKGQSKKVKQTINWRNYKEDTLVVTLESSDPAAVIVPKQLKLTFDDNERDFEFEIRAGQQAGDYTITVKPAVGEPVVVPVKVQ